jgi:transposase
MNVPIDRTRANEIHGVDISSRRSRLGLLGWHYFDQAGLFRQALSSKACGAIIMGICYRPIRRRCYDILSFCSSQEFLTCGRVGTKFRIIDPLGKPAPPSWIARRSRPPPPAAAVASTAPKKMVGRKRHIAVDTDGRLLMVNLTTGNIADSTWAQAVMEALRKRWPWIKHLFADGAYDRRQILDRAAFLDFVVEIVRRSDPGFNILPRRWVVERSFAWLTRYRRLVRDYEARIDVSEATIYAATENSLIRRVSHT